jgi:hypothetical protein
MVKVSSNKNQQSMTNDTESGRALVVGLWRLGIRVWAFSSINLLTSDTSNLTFIDNSDLSRYVPGQSAAAAMQGTRKDTL